MWAKHLPGSAPKNAEARRRSKHNLEPPMSRWQQRQGCWRGLGSALPPTACRPCRSARMKCQLRCVHLGSAVLLGTDMMLLVSAVFGVPQVSCSSSFSCGGTVCCMRLPPLHRRLRAGKPPGLASFTWVHNQPLCLKSRHHRGLMNASA